MQDYFSKFGPVDGLILNKFEDGDPKLRGKFKVAIARECRYKISCINSIFRRGAFRASLRIKRMPRSFWQLHWKIPCSTAKKWFGNGSKHVFLRTIRSGM